MGQKIEKIEKKEKVLRLKIGEWYSFFGPEQLSEGDEVEFKWETRGRYKTITEIKKVEKQPDKDHRESVLIVRQVCLKAAVEYGKPHIFTSNETPGNQVLVLAEEFEQWVLRG